MFNVIKALVNQVQFADEQTKRYFHAEIDKFAEIWSEVEHLLYSTKTTDDKSAE